MVTALRGAPARRTAVQGFDRWVVMATVAPLVAFTAFHGIGGTPRWLIGPTLLLGAPHVMATAGLYADRGLRPIIAADRRRYLWGPLLLIPLCATAFGVAGDTVGLLLLAALLLWQTQHYTKQNVGIFGLWVRARGGAPMTDGERRLIVATTAVGVLGVLRALGLAPWWDGALQMGGLMLSAALACVALAIGSGARRTALLVAVAFYLPLVAFDADLLGAAFAYQAAHGAQYYVVVGHTLRGEHRAQRVAIVAVLVGGVIAVALLSSATFAAAPMLFGLGKGVAAAHFLADAHLWRLRDPRIRAVLEQRLPFLLAGPPASVPA